MPESPWSESDILPLREYPRVIWRWKWLVALVVVASMAGAYLYSWRQAPSYRATTQLSYRQPLDVSNPLAGPSVGLDERQLALENVGNIAANPSVVRRAEAILGGPPAHPYEVTVELQGGTATSTFNNVAALSVVSADSAESADVANAYAQAVIEWSRDQQLAQLDQARRVTEGALKAFSSAASRRSPEYSLLLQRREDLRLLASAVNGEYQVIVPASAPSAPFSPRPKLAAAIGLIVGLMAGIGLALIAEMFSTSLRGRRDVSRALDLPVVGVIPDVPDRYQEPGSLVTLSQPDGRAAEALRMLRSNLDHFNADEISPLLVTSCVAGEGKSTTVCNLAVTLAMAGKRVIVVDGDLRKPSVHERFGIPNHIGVTSVLAGEVELVNALRPIDVPSPFLRYHGRNGSEPDSGPSPAAPRLLVLTAGPRSADPGEVVANNAFGAMIEDLKKSDADVVIIDSPALLEVGDAATMAAQVEGLIMVVDIHKVRRPALREAGFLLPTLPCRKLGAVMVKAKLGRSGYYTYGD